MESVLVEVGPSTAQVCKRHIAELDKGELVLPRRQESSSLPDLTYLLRLLFHAASSLSHKADSLRLVASKPICTCSCFVLALSSDLLQGL